MRIEYKSLFIGISVGMAGVFFLLYLFGNIETELSFKTGEIAKNKNSYKPVVPKAKRRRKRGGALRAAQLPAQKVQVKGGRSKGPPPSSQAPPRKSKKQAIILV